MVSPEKPPDNLSDFKGQPLRVTPTRTPKDPGDLEATRALILAYSDKDGFHCPRCGVTITNPDEAVEHLGEEINKALEQLGK